jgi:hypothetical protein
LMVSMFLLLVIVRDAPHAKLAVAG